MNRLPHIVHLAVAALILQGCAQMQWSKPGADTAAVSRDLDECRALALKGSGPALAPAASTEGSSDRGTARVMAPTAGTNERFVAEHEAASRCMTARGYRLQRP